MPIVVEECPLCHSKDNKIFDRRVFAETLVTNRLCAHCGFVYQSPRMSDMEISAFYRGSYRQVYQGSEGPTQKDVNTQRARAYSCLNFVQRNRVRSIQRHLDIGCSTGLLLEVIRESFSCESVGVEPGDAYRDSARIRGLRVYSTLKELDSESDAHFDFISMLHVLEHLSDPVGYLGQLQKKFLSPDGWLLIEVPNLYAHDCFEIAHLSAFSEFSLRNTLTLSGYSIYRIARHGLPRSRLIPLYLTILAKPAVGGENRPTPDIVREWGVVAKRQMGMLHRRVLERLLPGRAWMPVGSD